VREKPASKGRKSQLHLKKKKDLKDRGLEERVWSILKTIEMKRVKKT